MSMSALLLRPCSVSVWDVFAPQVNRPGELAGHRRPQPGHRLHMQPRPALAFLRSAPCLRQQPPQERLGTRHSELGVPPVPAQHVDVLMPLLVASQVLTQRPVADAAGRSLPYRLGQRFKARRQLLLHAGRLLQLLRQLLIATRRLLQRSLRTIHNVDDGYGVRLVSSSACMLADIIYSSLLARRGIASGHIAAARARHLRTLASCAARCDVLAADEATAAGS